MASALIYRRPPPRPPRSSSRSPRRRPSSAGRYASHIRGEGAALLGSIAELIEIAGRSGARAEIYHLKATGRPNWPKLGRAIEIVEAARAEGLPVTADVYPYHYSGTGLDLVHPAVGA